MLCACLAIPISTIISMLPRQVLVQDKGQCYDFVNLITVQWGRILWGAGRLIILQTDFYSRYFSTLQGGDQYSPGYLKSWEVNGCGGSRIGPLIHGWYINVFTEEKCVM